MRDYLYAIGFYLRIFVVVLAITWFALFIVADHKAAVRDRTACTTIDMDYDPNLHRCIDRIGVAIPRGATP